MRRRELIIAMISIASAAFLALNAPSFSGKRRKARNLENLRVIDGSVVFPVFIGKDENIEPREAIKRAEPKHGAKHTLVEFESGEQKYYPLSEILNGSVEISNFERVHLL